MPTILTVFLTTITTLFALPLLILAAPILTHRITLHLATRRRACATPTIRPSKDPIFGLDIGISDLLALKNNRRIKSWYASYQTYGRTFEFYAFGRRTVATIDARNVQFVLTTEAEKFGVGEFRRKASVPMMGSGVVNSDGEVWRKGRDLIMPVFARNNIADREMFAKHFNKALTRLKGDGVTVDLKPLFDELILDATSEFVFGESLNVLTAEGGSDEAREFIDAFNYAQKTVGLRAMLGKLRFLLRDQKFWSCCLLVHNYTKRHVEQALQHAQEKVSIDIGRETRKKYSLVQELASDTQDSKALSDQMLNFFFAGRDTPAAALSTVFFCLARHPLVWSKIREQVRGLRPDDLSFEKLKSLRYLQHSINEALRLYPILPNLSRVAAAETVLPYGGGPDGSQPVCIVPGDTVAWSTYTMHRNPEVYGADVESFRPERWPDIRPGWNYLPFSGGARHCPAQQLALFWVSYAVARMAMEFEELQNRDAVLEFVENLKLNMESGNGVKVALVKGQ